MAWALKQEIRPSSAKFLLVVMSDSADDQHCVCLPADFLANETCQEPEEVSANLATLVEHGFLTEEEYHPVARKNDLIFRMNVTKKEYV